MRNQSYSCQLTVNQNRTANEANAKFGRRPSEVSFSTWNMKNVKIYINVENINMQN